MIPVLAAAYLQGAKRRNTFINGYMIGGIPREPNGFQWIQSLPLRNYGDVGDLHIVGTCWDHDIGDGNTDQPTTIWV